MKLVARTGSSIVSKHLPPKWLKYLASRERLSPKEVIEILEKGPKETKGERQRLRRLQKEASRFPL